MPAVFIPVGLVGVAWMVVNSLAGQAIPFMRALGDWNIAIGLGLIVACFSFMTLWK
ncbi:cell division protein CrgA [Tessaracoccus coleopterorum]|uniref:cell division protein CrgA n=1 Tax=Tessaracoccus coleopterorum TaxID=2714950 RepID=UPI002F9171D4